MPYNYFDFIRDQERRNSQRRRSGYVQDGSRMIPISQANALRKELSNTRQGTNYFYSSRYGSDLSLKQLAFAKRNLDTAATEDERVNRIAYRNAQNQGANIYDADARGYGYGRRTTATPARDAAAEAISGTARLNDGDARAEAIRSGQNVLSASGATYFPSGGYARSSPISKSLNDFSNPAIAPATAEYLNASSPVNPLATNAPITGSNPGGIIAGSRVPVTPLIGTEPSPVNAPVTAPAANTTGVFGTPNVGAIAANLQNGISNYLQTARQSFVPYTKRDEDSQ